MTTDITELAQSLKAAAEKATPGEWHKGRQDPVTGIIKVYARTGSTKLNCVVKTDAHEVGFGISEREHKANAELIALANPVNIRALVEALEKAQQRIAELESRSVTVKLPAAWWVKQGSQSLLAYEEQMLIDALIDAGIKIEGATK